MLDLSSSALHEILAHLRSELLIWLLSCTLHLLNLLLALTFHLLLLHHLLLLLLLLLLEHLLLLLHRWAIPSSSFLAYLLGGLNVIAQFIE